MRDLFTRLLSTAGTLALSGAVLAQTIPGDNAIDLPEPGILELVAVAAVVGWIVHKRKNK